MVGALTPTNVGFGSGACSVSSMITSGFPPCWAKGEEYLAGDNPLGVAWSALMKMAKERRAAAAVEALERIAASDESPWRKLLLAECVQAYAPLNDSQRIELAGLLNDPKREGVRTIIKTWREEGEERGPMLVLQKQIEKRFQTPVTPEMNRRIAEMSPDRCDQLAVDLLTANSLKELGLED